MEAYRVSNGVKLERERSGWGTVVANSGPLSGRACEGVWSSKVCIPPHAYLTNMRKVQT